MARQGHRPTFPLSHFPTFQVTSPRQQDFPLFLIRKEDANVAWLIRTLQQHGWMTRKDLLRHINWPATDRNLRWVRALAEAAGAEVVKGQSGFNHVSNCTPEEISHAANQQIAQGKLMIKYGIALKRRAHQEIG